MVMEIKSRALMTLLLFDRMAELFRLQGIFQFILPTVSV